MALLALGNGVMWPALLSLMSRAAGERYQGVVQGYAGSSSAIASIVGPTLVGVAYGLVGGALFVVSAVVILLVSLLSARLLPGAAAR